MQCRECHAELPQGARRCPQCGRPVLHEKIWNNKRLRALLIGITIVLIAGIRRRRLAGRGREQPRQGRDLQLPV